MLLACPTQIRGCFGRSRTITSGRKRSATRPPSSGGITRSCAYEGRPALLAGRNDVDTCLGLGLDGGAEFSTAMIMASGALLGRADDAGKLPALCRPAGGSNFVAVRGRLPVAKEVPLRSRDLVERVMAVLAEAANRQTGVLSPSAGDDAQLVLIGRRQRGEERGSFHGCNE